MEEHRRSPEVTEELIIVVSTALRLHPEQRLGQLLCNVSRGGQVFDVRDEWIIQRLRPYTRLGG